ncbi:MAG: hypothetical protein HKN21_13015, partial [Candidatus Eisenbacteria bacterium]|nr:hypothetical protein [Candidatus Eisenbacteria bacterium]
LEGDLSEERRSHHIVTRLGFLGALWRHLGKDSLLLYRGMVTKKLWGDQRNTFVSSSFSEEVSKSHYLSAPELNGVLLRQNVEVSRVFMTYLETEAMSKQFLEAEAVLFYSADAFF